MGPRHVLDRVGLLTAIKGLIRTRIPGEEWGIPETGNDRSRQAFVVKCIEPQRLDLVRAYAHERRVTINDVLLTAFCRSLFTALNPPLDKRLRVEVPTNLRRHLPEEHSIVSDLSSVYFLNIDRRPEESFEETLMRVHADIEANKNGHTELGQILLLELMLLPGSPFVRRLKRFFEYEVAHPALSNVGIIDLAMASFGDVGIEDIQLIGPTRYPPNLALDVCTYRQRMTLRINCCSSATDIGTIDRVLDLLLDELPGAADRASTIPAEK
jgi:NRPS condensation-like uncharacterized protein